MAARIASSVCGSSAAVTMAARALVTYVRTVDFTALLRARRFSSWRMRFLADWIFGIVESYLLRGPAAAVVTKLRTCARLQQYGAQAGRLCCTAIRRSIADG